jgi:hypothetical protein
VQQHAMSDEASGHPGDENHDPGNDEPLVHDSPLVAMHSGGRSGIARGNDCRSLNHQDDRSFRGTRAMDDSLWYDKSLLPVELNAPILEVHDKAAVEDKEELVIVVVLVPVILTLQDAQPNDRVVDLA